MVLPAGSLRRPSNVWSNSSKPANSSLGARAGCTSDWPFICAISLTGSLSSRRRAYASSIGRPSLSVQSYMMPLLMLPCGE